MDITLSHCGSESVGMYLYLLDESGATIDFTSYGCPENGDHAYLYKALLAQGTYYVVSEAFILDKNITTRISGTARILPGDTRETAIDVGTHNSYFHYEDSRDTRIYSNQYQGRSTNDVFYKFTLTSVMDITLLQCGSLINDTYAYLLNSSGTVITSYNFSYLVCCGTHGDPMYVEAPGLPPGTYYVVSEGTNANGNIYTEIVGKDPGIPGDKRSTAIDAGRYGTSFSYTDTRDTRHYSDQYPAKPLYDVFYQFTITSPMDMTISNCGSEVGTTYLYVLNESGTLITSFDGSSPGCSSNSTQAYLEIAALPPGSYYVVTEGPMGNTVTRIAGETFYGYSRQDPIDAGTYAEGFASIDTNNQNS